jgi:hypothetical protein
MDGTDQVLIVGFVVGVIKVLRTRFTAVDGAPVVAAIAVFAGAVAATVLALATTGRIDVQTVARGFVSGAAAVGSITAIDRFKADPAS